MKRITISILFSACVLFVACGGRPASSSDSDVNPRDTVKVPEGYTGEDSIARFKPILKRISPEVKFGIFLFYNTSVYKGFRNIERYNFFLKIVRNPTFL